MQAKRKIADREVFAKQECAKCAEHTAQNAQLKVDLHELEGKLDFLERLNNVTDTRYSMVGDECDFLQLQIAS